ncbi:MAG TPA: enoyl-CoA hydratase/isomerase family protein [Gemmatimonadales bacterium]|nr:enoyl-CoA hydratase/isomerase family protein [Gemmatimonadales bacterium]
MTDELRTGLADGVLTLTLDRPAKRNALGTSLVESLHQELDRADLDAAVRVVLLRGNGPDFCAGADLDELLASVDRPLDENERDALRLGTLFSRMRSLPKPVVATVHGRALAGGAGLVLAADLVVLADDAWIGFPEIRRGFVPAMVLTLLRRAVPEKIAFDLVATGRLVDASPALGLGLVSRVVPGAELETEGVRLARELAGAPVSAMGLLKRLFYELDGIGFADGVALGARVNASARATPEFRDAVAGFLGR